MGGKVEHKNLVSIELRRGTSSLLVDYKVDPWWKISQDQRSSKIFLRIFARILIKDL